MRHFKKSNVFFIGKNCTEAIAISECVLCNAQITEYLPQVHCFENTCNYGICTESDLFPEGYWCSCPPGISGWIWINDSFCFKLNI